MTRLLAAAAAGALFLLLRLTTPAPPVIGVGLLAVGLSAVAIAATWRWAATSAAVVFLIGYAAALGIERRPVDVGAALGFGLALILLLGAVDLSARARGASLHGRVVGTTLGRFIGLGAGALAAALLAMALATGVATALTSTAAPLLAAAGALAFVWSLAALVRRAAGPS